MLCDFCHEREATVFVTKIVDNETTKQRLCEECARRRALGEGWLQQLTGEDATQLEGVPLEEIVMSLFAQAEADEPSDEYSLSELAALHNQISGETFGDENFAVADLDAEFPADEDLVDELDEGEFIDEDFIADEMGETGDDDAGRADGFSHLGSDAALGSFDSEGFDSDGFDSDGFDSGPDGDSETEQAAFNPFATPSLSGHPFPGARGEIPVVRCPKCETTWDRLRQDGRVGCAHCYEAFREQLNEVMERLQSAGQHIGKAPRTAAKRRRRLEHLRARRDHRLEMLNARLAKAIAAEDYEEAAKLRDKIRIVASTIVSNEL